MVEYINPLTGGHCLSTQAYYLQLLHKGFHGKAQRTTAHSFFYVVRGKGATIVDGARLTWETGDTVLAPSWRFYEHVADEETFLLKITDLPLREPFGLHREEKLTENGGHQILNKGV